MIRKNSKFLLSILLIALLTLSFCFNFALATDAVVTSEVSTENQSTQATTEATDTTQTTEEPEVFNGDLYLMDNKVVMDKLVDGNVFILGQEVEITGQVNGNLFVCANKISFNNSYVRYSVYACANSIYYNGACNDLYAFCSNDLEMTYDSYVIRDINAYSSKINFLAAVGRNANMFFNTINLGEAENIPIVYGNLNYTAPSQVTIPEGVITDKGTVNYTNSINIFDILLNALTCIITVLVLYVLIKKCCPKSAEKINNEKISFIQLLKSFAIGLITIIATIAVSVLLIFTQVGIKLSFILLLVFGLLCLISIPVLALIITNCVAKLLKTNKSPIFYIILSVISLVLYALTLIPVVGIIISLILYILSIGVTINMHLPKKVLTEEEKLEIEKSKKLAKENKEKRKQEKAEKKLEKKQAKLEEKEAKKKQDKI